LPQGRPTEASTQKNDLTVLERSMPGELPTSAHPQLVQEIQDTLGVAGHATQLGSSLTWSPAAEGVAGRKLVVTANAGGGETRIRVEEKYTLNEWRLFAPGWGAALGAAGMAGLFAGLLGMSEGPGLVVPLLIGAVGGAITSANLILSLMSSRRRPLLRQLADRLTNTAAGSIAAADQTLDDSAPRQIPGGDNS
jgi:hypothetical protein